MFRRLLTIFTAALLGLATACASSQPSKSSPDGRSPVELRLGYFANITHAAALAGVDKGIFAKHLGASAVLKTTTFNAGPLAVEAIFADAVDIAYIGPSPTINAYAKSGGEAIRIIAGATSGGAALVVKSTITEFAQLKSAKIATPQLGNTQDVALRAWLKGKGLSTDPQGGGDVSVIPQENAQTLDTFRSGGIDGAWVPEPWATRLAQEGRGKVLVDESSLWPKGEFVTTNLIVATAFLKSHPDVVKQFLRGHVEATDYVRTATDAASVVNAGIGKITGKQLTADVIAAAWPHLTFTVDPIASSLRKGAADAVAVGLLRRADLKGIYDLRLLNDVLSSSGSEPVRS